MRKITLKERTLREKRRKISREEYCDGEKERREGKKKNCQPGYRINTLL